MAARRDPSPHISVADAARLLRVDPRTIRGDIASGRLPAKRVGTRGLLRIDPADLELLRTGEDQPGQPGPPSHSARRARREGRFARFAREAGTLHDAERTSEAGN